MIVSHRIRHNPPSPCGREIEGGEIHPHLNPLPSRERRNSAEGRVFPVEGEEKQDTKSSPLEGEDFYMKLCGRLFIVICKNGYTEVIARLMNSAEAISEVEMRLPRFARNDQ